MSTKIYSYKAKTIEELSLWDKYYLGWISEEYFEEVKDEFLKQFTSMPYNRVSHKDNIYYRIINFDFIILCFSKETEYNYCKNLLNIYLNINKNIFSKLYFTDEYYCPSEGNIKDQMIFVCNLFYWTKVNEWKDLSLLLQNFYNTTIHPLYENYLMQFSKQFPIINYINVVNAIYLVRSDNYDLLMKSIYKKCALMILFNTCHHSVNIDNNIIRIDMSDKLIFEWFEIKPKYLELYESILKHDRYINKLYNRQDFYYYKILVLFKMILTTELVINRNLYDGNWICPTNVHKNICECKHSIYNNKYSDINLDTELKKSNLINFIKTKRSSFIIKEAESLNNIRHCYFHIIDPISASFYNMVKDSIPKQNNNIKNKYRYSDRNRLIKLQDNKCGICNAEIIENCFEVDHLIPVSCNGPNDDINLLCMCPNCHSLKTKYIDPLIRMQIKQNKRVFSRKRLIQFIKYTIEDMTNLEVEDIKIIIPNNEHNF